MMDIWSVDPVSSVATHEGHSNNEASNDEDEALISVLTKQTKVYKRRWWILILFSAVCATQGGVWNTWGPIAESAKAVFGWSDGTIALLINWGAITYILGAAPIVWIMDVKGVRSAAVLSAALITAGTGLRCITSQATAATWLIHVGQILSGFGGPFAMAASPLVSALWFPVEQRTTATAIGAMCNGVGVSISFILGPLLVFDPSNSSSTCNASSGNSNSSAAEIVRMKSDIMRLMYMEFAGSAFLFLLVLLYFPSRPPLPPSVTASIQRLNFTNGLKSLMRNSKFWCLATPYAISLGVYNCWSSVLEVNLCPKGIDQDEAGWLGFYSVLAGCGAALLIAWFSDIFKRQLKVYLILLFMAAGITFVVFSAAHEGILPISRGLLYSTVIFSGVCLLGAVPLFYELCCEITYPVAEGVTNGVLTLLNNLAGFIFLMILMVPHIGTSWMNWCQAGCIVASMPFLFVVNERYTRLDIDTNTTHPGMTSTDSSTTQDDEQLLIS